jgi:hypothetical protein
MDKNIPHSKSSGVSRMTWAYNPAIQAVFIKILVAMKLFVGTKLII